MAEGKGANVGSAYVTLMPSMRGFADEIGAGLSKTGASAGKSFSSSLSKSLGDPISKAVGKDTLKAQSSLSALVSAAKEEAGYMGIAFEDAVGTVSKAVSSTGAWQALTAKAKAAANGITAAFSGIKQGVSARLSGVASVVQAGLSRVGSVGKSVMAAASNLIPQPLKSVASVAGAALKPVSQAAKSALSTLKPYMGQVASDAVGALKDGLSKAGSAVSSVLGTAAKGAAAGAAAVTAAVAAVGGAALAAYADYEQLVGGVDTLFKSASAQVQQYAANAYKTAGMSANTYMETVTGFSATLLQGLGGDTAQAARIADVAIQDMSDNANKMGTDIQMIRDAYQGFAKQNYDMLDNLKLGYGGTQAEMARLINDSGVLGDSMKVTAETVKDVPFDKMIEAIHQVQTEMGITGTTSLEAATTIQGSMSMAKAAWDNFLTGLGRDDVDFSMLTTQLLDAIGTVATNVAPRVAIIGRNIIEAFPTVLAGLGSVLAPIASEALAAAWNIAVQALAGVGLQLPTVDASQILNAFQQVADFITGTLAPAFMPVAQAVGNFASVVAPLLIPLIQQIGSLLAGIAPVIAIIMTAVINVVTQIAALVLPILTEIVGWVVANMPMIQAVVTSVMGTVQAVVTAALGVIQGIWNAVWPAVKGVIDAVFPAIQQVISGVMDAIQGIINVVLGIINGDWSQVWDGMCQFVSGILETIQGVVNTAISAVRSVIDGGLSAIKGIWEGAWNALGSLLDGAWNGFVEAVFGGNEEVLSVLRGLPGKITGIFSGIGSWLIGSGRALLDGFIGGIQSGFNAAVGAVKDGLSWIRGFFPFSPAKEGPFAGHGYTTFSGKALMGDFAESIKSQAGKVAAATRTVLGVAQDGLSTQLTTAQAVSVNRPEGSGYGDALSAICDLLEQIAGKDTNVYMDSTKVSAVLTARSRIAMAGRGLS